MEFRRIVSIFALIFLGGILVACGSEDEETEPTAETAITEEAPTTAATDPATETASAEASPEASTAAEATPAASLADEASPVASLTDEATPAASPMTGATDNATPVATPTGDDSVGTPEADEETDSAAIVPVSADTSEESTPASLTEITGTLTLDGREQQDYMITSEGCVGLGEWRQLQPGTQVIVRDAHGTVVDISSLNPAAERDVCQWSFAIEAPGSDFFSVSIPMVTEVWFDQADDAVQAGVLELFVP